MQFRLLAIRPIEDPNNRYTKALSLDTFYSLYAAFNFDKYIDTSNEVIEYDETKEIDLYSFGVTNVSVSAIVGKNGTGKSSLVELFYALIFLLSKQVGFIDNMTIRETHEFTEDEMNKYTADGIELDKIRVQVFYQLGESVFSLTKRRKVEVHKFRLQNGQYSNPERIRLTHAFVKKHFFYSVATNYSLYALNTNECGLWLKPLFHKNDAYQTPLVLNPMRTRGDIDINRVTYLSKNRLLANLLSPIPKQINKEDSLRSLVNGKVADSLVFQIDETKFYRWNAQKRMNEVNLDYIEKHPDKIAQIVNAFAITERDKKNKEVFKRFLQKANHLEKFTLEYILRKTEKIGRTYYYSGVNRSEFSLSRPRLLANLLTELSTDYSHVTFKIRQAINFLRYNELLKDNTHNHPIKIDTLSDNLQKSITRLREKKLPERINDFKSRKKKEENETLIDAFNEEEYFKLINFLPPSFLSFDIQFENEGSYLQLSSGERQKVYTVSSVIYHLVNLNSVEKKKIKYDYVNLIFDEIELYFHPEFQRTFLDDLLGFIQKSGIDLRGINILFITHSPFILSDIPKFNTLFLEKNKEDKYAHPVTIDINTFAANIHELLAEGFFMDHTKGAVASRKIEELVSLHDQVKAAVNNKKDLESFKESYIQKQQYFSRMVSCIGEDYLRKILENQIINLGEMLGILSKDKLDKEILILKQKLDVLEKKKNSL